MRIHHALAISVLAIAVCACSGSSSDAPPLSPSSRVLVPRPDAVSNVDQPSVRWAAVAGAASYVVRVWVGEDTTAQPIREQTVDAATLQVTVTPALVDGVYSVGFEARGADGVTLSLPEPNRFAVKLPPDWMPGVEVGGASPQLTVGGYTLLNLIDIFNPPGTDKISALVMVNEYGEIVWWMRFDRFPGFLMSPKVLDNGNLLFLAMHSPPPAGQATVSGQGFETDWQGNVVWQSPAGGATPHHEIERLPDGRILMLTWVYDDYLEPITGAIVRLEGDGIEIHNPITRQIEWSWNIFDHIDPIEWWVPDVGMLGLSFGGQEWAHANAVEWDADRGVFWLSLRHFDQLLGIDYPSGDIKYTIGRQSFGEAPVLMSHQHAPEVQADGSILLYDNGNSYATPETRVTRIEFDEVSGRAEIVWQWRDDPAFFDFAVGDADLLPNGNILITAGISRRVIEIEPGTGNIVWEMRLIQDPAAARFGIYRSEHVDAGQVPAGVLPFGR